MAQPPLIEIHNATVWRGKTRVFDRFSLTIGQGERVAILGPNGAGKTTLLKLLSREVRPVVDDDAWVKILGNARFNVWELREHIGLVSHDLQTGFSPRATVFEAVVSGFFSSIGLDDRLRDRITEEQRERTARAMASMGVDSLSERPYSSLSTGQQRRCLLARALIHDPDTLVFDEPTAGLDLTASFEFLEQARALARQGRSLVWVTHHLGDIPPEVERVIVLKEGRVIADGAKAEILTADVLSPAFDVPLRITEVDGHFLAYPAAR